MVHIKYLEYFLSNESHIHTYYVIFKTFLNDKKWRTVDVPMNILLVFFLNDRVFHKIKINTRLPRNATVKKNKKYVRFLSSCRYTSLIIKISGHKPDFYRTSLGIFTPGSKLHRVFDPVLQNCIPIFIFTHGIAGGMDNTKMEWNINPFSAKDELTRLGPWKWQNDLKSRNWDISRGF